MDDMIRTSISPWADSEVVILVGEFENYGKAGAR